MGTSSNHPSPNTPSWTLAKSVLGSTSVPDSLQSIEVWRAALGDRGDLLIDALGSPLLAGACRLASSAQSPTQAIHAFESLLVDSHAAGLTLDLGKRALAKAIHTGSGAAGFARELFAEMAGYYASRDLPSFVGAPNRVATTSQAIALKDALREHARSAAQSVRLRTDPAGWRRYIRSTLSILTGGTI